MEASSKKSIKDGIAKKDQCYSLYLTVRLGWSRKVALSRTKPQCCLEEGGKLFANSKLVTECFTCEGNNLLYPSSFKSVLFNKKNRARFVFVLSGLA